MGVSQILAKVLAASGRPMTDLTEYARIVSQEQEQQQQTAAAAAAGSGNEPHRRHHRSRRRRLRIGVDIATWIHRASQGKGEMLADERFLDNYGRAELLQQQQQLLQQQGMDQQQEQQQQKQQQQEQERLVKEEREHLYIQECTRYVLDRLLLLHHGEKGAATVGNGDDDDALFSILVVLDGSTPPIKRPLVKERSGKRNEAIRQRDEAINTATTNNNNTNTNNENNEHEHVIDNEEAADAADDARLQRRLKGFRRAGAGKKLFGDIVDSVIHAMRCAKICFMVAPYEADGQLTYLASQGLIDLIVTEDSDLIIASYASRNCNSTGHKCPILYKLITTLQPGYDNNNNDNTNNKKLSGVLIRSDDLGSRKVATVLNEKSGKGLCNLADFTPAMMAVLFVAAGCDYCESLRGIGIGNACTIVRDAFLKKREKRESSSSSSPLEQVFANLYKKAYCKEKDKFTDEFKATFERNFMGALLMFRHPTVYDPILGCCRTMNLNNNNNNSKKNDGGGDAELLLYKPYAKLLQNAEARHAFVGSLITPPQLATFMAEGWVSPRTNKLRSIYIMQSTTTTTTTATTAATTTGTNQAGNSGATTTARKITTSSNHAHLPEHVRLWLEQNCPQALGATTISAKEGEIDDDKEGTGEMTTENGAHANIVATAFAGKEGVNNNGRLHGGSHHDNFATQQQQVQQPPSLNDSAVLSPPHHVALPKRSITDDKDNDPDLNRILRKRQRSYIRAEDMEHSETQNV